MSQGKVNANNIEIWYEDFGNPSSPSVILIMGGGAQGIMWPMGLINKITDAGYHVVRFDNRDTGLSTWISDFNASPYTLKDMADDAVGLMDALDIEKAHIIGWSMGGMIAQLAAIHNPERTLSLTSWSSSYWSNDPDVPAMSEELISWFKKLMENPPPVTDKEIIDGNIKIQRMFKGNRYPFDEKWLTSMLKESLKRGWDLTKTQNHTGAVMTSPSRRETLKNLNIPALIIHGTEDPVINYAHGVVCARVIKGAKLLLLKGVGHEIPSDIMTEAVEAVVKHFG